MKFTAGLLMSASLFAASSIYDFTPKSIDGAPAPLSAYKGKAALIVNVASKCGYTPQYGGLESLYEKYKEKGLVLLGFPANNFGAQEPGSDAEIKTFCSTRYNVTFPMFSKISVAGGDKDPLYQYLTSSAGDVKWNFTKFLVGKDGKVIRKFDSAVAPDAAELIAAIEAALKLK
jgi:glutathione peroxidase